MKKLYINGTFALFFANILGKLFGAIYRIPLSNILGAEGMGLYQMAFPTYSFLLCILTGGVSVVLTRKIATCRATNNIFNIQKNYQIAKKISLFWGAIFFVFLLFLALPLSYIQGNKFAFWGYISISFGFVFASMLGAYRGYYQGYGNMMPTAISQVLEQFFKLVIGLIFALVFIKKGTVWGVFGALLGVSLSEFLCFVCFCFYNKKYAYQKIKFTKEEQQTFAKECLPISLTYGLMPFSSLIDSFLIVNLLTLSGFSTMGATALYGVETGMILPLINMPNVLISAIAISGLPTLSYMQSQNQNLQNQTMQMFKTAYIFILPCCVGLFMLSKPILSFVYPTLSQTLLNTASDLLKFSVVEMFLLCFVTITNSILQATKQQKVPLFSMGVGLALKTLITICLVLISSINIFGLVIASTAGYLVTLCINLKKINKQCKILHSWHGVAIPILACGVMAFLLFAYLHWFVQTSFLQLVAVIMLCGVTYFAVLIIFGQINIKNLIKSIIKTS